MEDFIGKPHVYTVDIHNIKQLNDVLKEISSTEVRCHGNFLDFVFSIEVTQRLDRCTQPKITHIHTLCLFVYN